MSNFLILSRRRTGNIFALSTGTAMAVIMTAATAGAADLPSMKTAPDAPAIDFAPQAPAPIGVFGVDMPGAGKFVFANTNSFSRNGGNLIGTNSVTPLYIITNVTSPYTPNGFAKLHMVPQDLRTFSEGLSVAYGVTDNLSVSVATAFLEKAVDMETFTKGSTAVLGYSTGRTEGIGDTQVAGVWRAYRDNINQINVNLGLSLPTGSTTNNQVLLLPTGLAPLKRAFYAMQEGSGTVDALPGVAYSGVLGPWSWGFSYRGRLPLDNNAQGWRYGTITNSTPGAATAGWRVWRRPCG